MFDPLLCIAVRSVSSPPGVHAVLFLPFSAGFSRYPMVGYIYKVNSTSSEEIWL